MDLGPVLMNSHSAGRGVLGSLAGSKVDQNDPHHLYGEKPACQSAPTPPVIIDMAVGQPLDMAEDDGLSRQENIPYSRFKSAQKPAGKVGSGENCHGAAKVGESAAVSWLYPRIKRRYWLWSGMINRKPQPLENQDAVPRIADWAGLRSSETIENASFSSGAALSVLHMALQNNGLPQALLRARLGLRAAEACVGFSGRQERAADLRDEVHLLRPGDQPGPAGAIYQQWLTVVAHPLRIGRLRKSLPEPMQGRVAGWLAMGHGSPVAQVASVVEFVLSEFPRHEAEALILGDVVLARACGWEYVVPLLASGLKTRDLRKTGDQLRLACHRAVFTSASAAVQLASDLTRRAGRLRAVAPKLRAKAADQAVEMFLSQDAVSPSVALTGLMSDRAARRLCDRLVDLGVVQELTGRATFRLYGVGA